jgi:hypothetical protein
MMAKDMDESVAQAETFELAGQRLSLQGTSGASNLPQRTAEGSPVFHTAIVGGQTLSLRKTSGLSKHPQQVAQGSPNAHETTAGAYRFGASAPSASSGMGGVREKTGMRQATVISGSAGVHPK